MSDLLTHWAVFDDCRRLAAHDRGIAPVFNELLTSHRDVARLGAIARSGSRWVPHLLKQARAKCETTLDERARQGLAFALGGMLHFPADQVLKPLMSRLAQADWNSAHHLMQGRDVPAGTLPSDLPIREISAYYDCHVFREVYLAGNEEPFSRFLIADNATAPGQELEAFVRALFQRALLAAHTLAPEMSDDMSRFDAWLDGLLRRVQPLYLDIALYVRVWTQPDPHKLALYEVESLFYRDDDPLTLLARAAQRGESIASADLEAALQREANRAAYSECLRMGVETLRGASAFWRGEANEPPSVKQQTDWKPAGAGAAG